MEPGRRLTWPQPAVWLPERFTSEPSSSPKSRGSGWVVGGPGPSGSMGRDPSSKAISDIPAGRPRYPISRTLGRTLSGGAGMSLIPGSSTPSRWPCAQLPHLQRVMLSPLPTGWFRGDPCPALSHGWWSTGVDVMEVPRPPQPCPQLGGADPEVRALHQAGGVASGSSAPTLQVNVKLLAPRGLSLHQCLGSAGGLPRVDTPAPHSRPCSS